MQESQVILRVPVPGQTLTVAVGEGLIKQVKVIGTIIPVQDSRVFMLDEAAETEKKILVRIKDSPTHSTWVTLHNLINSEQVQPDKHGRGGKTPTQVLTATNVLKHMGEYVK